jgi:hypothetical protein
MFIPDPDLDFLPIPGPGSRSATLIEQKVDAPYLTAESRQAIADFNNRSIVKKRKHV